MPRIISSYEKLSVIEHWLSGDSRNDIAIRHNIGSGTVYNIVEEWSYEVGPQLADRLRELAKQLKKNGLTVIDCAKGLHMLMILKKYGIKDDENQEKVPYFLKEIYTTCQEVGLKPQQVFDYISDILKFSNEIPISQIPEFMKKRLEEKEKIESEVQELSRKRDELTEIKEEIEHEIQRLKNIQETMSKTFRTFTMAKFQLKQYGIGMDNMEQFVKCVVGVSKEGYNPVQVLTKIKDHETLEKEANYYREEVNILKAESVKLDQLIASQKNDLSYLKIKVDSLNDLESRGFGIKELRILINMLNEIGLENKQVFEETKKEFFNDIKNYEEIIGSRKERERLKNELKILEEQTMKEREKYNSYPKVIESIRRLAGSRISENDIVNIDKILSMTDYYNYKDKRLYKEGLIDDLQKYGNLKLAIKDLEDRERNLKSIKTTQRKPTNKKPNNVSKPN
jgi:hypothetical protein